MFGNLNIKDNQPHPIPFEIDWSILAYAKPFNPVTGVCRLCLLEAYYLMFDPENCSLNEREEFWGSCPHRGKFLLSKQKGYLLSLSDKLICFMFC